MKVKLTVKPEVRGNTTLEDQMRNDLLDNVNMPLYDANTYTVSGFIKLDVTSSELSKLRKMDYFEKVEVLKTFMN